MVIADAVDLRRWCRTSSGRRCRFYDGVSDDRRHPVLHRDRCRRWATGHSADYAALVAAASPPSDVQWRQRGRVLPLDAPAPAPAGICRAGWGRGGLCTDGQSRVGEQCQQLWRHPPQRTVIAVHSSWLHTSTAHIIRPSTAFRRELCKRVNVCLKCFSRDTQLFMFCDVVTCSVVVFLFIIV